MRVLLVDDEKELVTTLAERLSYRGIDAEWATNAEDALKLADAKTYDIALLDVKMPKISGIELKKRLKSKHTGMKFIFLTGHGSEDDFRAGTAETGTAYYLVKPIKIEALIEKMNEILRG
jgi:DNA-binding response OmpR family regulator